MLMMAGMGMLAGAIRIPEAHAGPYIFQDEFDGPAGSPPDPAKWTIQTWQDDVFPPVAGIYRDDRRNVFQDGNSNLVLAPPRKTATTSAASCAATSAA